MSITLRSKLTRITGLLFCELLLASVPLTLMAATTPPNCIKVTSFTPSISTWWVSGTFAFTNTCTTPQSVNGLQLVLSANQALNAANFSLNNVSYPSWASSTATAIPVSGNANTMLITLTTTASLPANSQASGSFGYNTNGIVLTGLTLSGHGTAAPVINPVQPGNNTPPPAQQTSAGVLYFHAYVPQTSISAFKLGDSMNLSGDTYTDLIMSNYIAGVLLGHMIVESFPTMQFNKDYMYGTIFAQLLQENLETELYTPSSNLIAPSSLQVAVMGSGQGGPYQINSYAQDMVGGSYTPSGYSLVNYVAIQKNIGYTISQQAAQATKATPAQFNDKYYGPVLTAYFHLNDLRALAALENGSQGYTSSAAPNYTQCMKNLVSIPNNPLDIITNYAYNQGFFGGLVGSSTTDCINSTPTAFLAKYNSYNNASGSSYNEYPYQIRFYLDELYNQSTLTPATNNHVAFNMTMLGNVFSSVFQTLAYVNSSGQYVYISANQANTAFSAALAKANVANGTILDLSDSSQRATIYKLLETAITNLELALNTNFSVTTTTDLTSTASSGGSGGTSTGSVPTCPSPAVLYPAGLGTYVGGTIVTASNGYFYQCISNQIAPWCNSALSAYYAPATGYAWTSAWNLYNCKH